MPAVQRGHVRKRGNSWSARYYDEDGTEREKGGFRTRNDANDFLDTKVEEVEAVRSGDLVAARDRPRTVDELLDRFLDKHGRTVDPATARKLETQLRKARAEFADRDPSSLLRLELEDWREALPAGSRPYVFRAFKQALTWGHDRGLIDRNPAGKIRNPYRPRSERRPIVPFENWQEIEAIAEGLDPRYQAIPVFATGTGLRPEEWIALERGDIDRAAGVVHVHRRYSGGELKQGTKTRRVPTRAVPLRRRVLEALDAMTPRIDTPILFPAPRGGYIDLEKFRHREWAPAVRAAGLARRGPYTMRHTFATWALEEGRVPAIQLATIMGTSLRELDDTYHRWLRRTDDRIRAALDAADAKEALNG
jgi:integrase